MTDIIQLQDYLKLAREIEQHHVLFQYFFKLGKPVFSDKVKTAAVGFNRSGSFIEFIFNPNYWNTLNTYERAFIIAHECLHVILNHGLRSIGDLAVPELWNYAADIVVNHTLVKKFGFERDKISNSNKMCWIDTVFKNTIVQENGTAEYYYKNIVSNATIKHVYFLPADINPGDAADIYKKFQDIGKCLSETDKNVIKELMKTAGISSDNLDWIGKAKNTNNRKWESIIKKLVHKTMTEKEEYQWVFPNRRLVLLDDYDLPQEAEVEEILPDKPKIWFFIDVSGSCKEFVQKFIDVANSLHKTKCTVQAFLFSTRIQPVDLKKKLDIRIGGGTSFSAIDAYVNQNTLDGKQSYPKLIFVLTDGYGNDINPKMPEKWFWFLTPKHDTTYIPAKSTVFKLADFD